MRYGNQAVDIDAFDTSMDVDVALGNRVQGYGKSMPVASAYSNHGHSLLHQHDHGHGHAHVGHDSHAHGHGHDSHTAHGHGNQIIG